MRDSEYTMSRKQLEFAVVTLYTRPARTPAGAEVQARVIARLEALLSAQGV